MYIEVRIWRFILKIGTGFLEKEKPEPEEVEIEARIGFRPNDE